MGKKNNKSNVGDEKQIDDMNGNDSGQELNKQNEDKMDEGEDLPEDDED